MDLRGNGSHAIKGFVSGVKAGEHAVVYPLYIKGARLEGAKIPP